MKIREKTLNKLKKRIYELSYKHKLSHIGSCITALPIIYLIYKRKKPKEPFVLSVGHAALALYVVLEQLEGKNAEDLLLRHGVHPNRNVNDGLYASTGSLGHGLGIALGMALADHTRQVYCLISDGEAREGSIWEALMTQRMYHTTNLKIYCNFNGWGAYHKIQRITFHTYPVRVYKTKNTEKFLKGQSAHYYTMSKKDYKFILEKYENS